MLACDMNPQQYETPAFIMKHLWNAHLFYYETEKKTW